MKDTINSLRDLRKLQEADQNSPQGGTSGNPPPGGSNPPGNGGGQPQNNQQAQTPNADDIIKEVGIAMNNVLKDVIPKLLSGNGGNNQNNNGGNNGQ